MPVGPYKDFKTCVQAQVRAGKSEESAGAICATIEKKSRGLNEYHVLSEINFADTDDLENKEFEVLRVGKKVYRGGTIDITQEMLNEMEENFKENVVGTQLALDINHDPEHVAFAWVADVYVKGESLIMKFKDFSEEGAKMIKEKMFKYFSVEFETKFQNIINGVKKTFNNVLRGVALTNRPVDKAIAPTFFNEQENLINNNSIMFKKLLSELKKRDKITASDVELLKTLSEELSEEEVAEVAEEVAEVEKKAEETAKADKAEENDNENGGEADDADVEAKAEALAEKKISAKLAEMQSQLDKEKNARRQRELSDEVASVTLSEENGIGILPAKKDEVVNFLMTLSEKQAKEALDLMKLQVVDFSEHGVAGKDEEGETDELSELSDDEKKLLKAEVEKYSK